MLAPSHDTSPELALALARIRTPIVLLDREVAGLAVDALYVDQDKGIGGAMDHLVGRGPSTHRPASPATRRRGPGRQILAAYRAHCLRLGHPLEAWRWCRSSTTSTGGRLATGSMRSSRRGADAIISTGTMELSAIVLERLSELGVAVPRDLSIAVYGYIGGPMSAYSGLPRWPTRSIASPTPHGRCCGGGMADRHAPPRTDIIENVFVAPQANSSPRA